MAPVVAGVLCVGFTLGILGTFPHIADEVTYLFEARLVLRGRAAAPAPDPMVETLSAVPFTKVHEGRWLAAFPPGWPLVLAVGVLLGIPYLVNGLLAGVNLMLIGRFARRHFGEELGIATVLLAVLSPFLMHYVVGMPEMTAIIFIPYLISQLLTVFVWTEMSRRVGKRATWLTGMGVAVVGYVTIFFVGHHDLYLRFLVVTLTGAASSCGQVIGPSIQADVVDYDEYTTGERKEGSYFAVFTFLMKSSSGVMIILTGFALSLVGYEPNAEQTELVKFTISALMSWVAGSCFIAAIWIFARFELTEREHARIRAVLDARAQERLRVDEHSGP